MVPVAEGSNPSAHPKKIPLLQTNHSTYVILRLSSPGFGLLRPEADMEQWGEKNRAGRNKLGSSAPGRLSAPPRFRQLIA